MTVKSESGKNEGLENFIVCIVQGGQILSEEDYYRNVECSLMMVMGRGRRMKHELVYRCFACRKTDASKSCDRILSAFPLPPVAPVPSSTFTHLA
jgi:hypothetical protein